MTANSQMQIRLHKALPEAAPDGPRIMPVIVPAEAVCIELPDGTTFSGVVTSESAEIDNQARVVTKTIRVRPEGNLMKANKVPKKLGRASDAPTNVAPQVIRTREELAALDPDTLVAMNPITKGHATAYVWSADTALRVNLLWHAPMVVIATGDHVRAARQALGGA